MNSASLWFLLIIVFVVCLIFYIFWVAIPILAGLPWRPTSLRRIRRALELARVHPGELIYDLGAGDGRVLVVAARDFHLRAVGIEISPLHCLFARMYAWVNHVGDLVRIKREDFYQAELGEADVVFAYMTSAQVSRLKPHLESQLKSGARVVTISFDIDGWEPNVVDRDQLIFLYEMPARKGSLESYLADNL